MTTGRPSAKQAIEVLKIHQLRRENAVVLEELKGLREDITNRQNDLDGTRTDVSMLTDEFKRMQQIVCDYGTRLDQLDTGSASYTEELRALQQAPESLREELFKANTAFNATSLQNQNAIEELVREVTLLKNQVVACEDTCANSVNELRHDLANRAEKRAIAGLEDKLEHFVQEIDTRLEALQRISCVTDSFASPRNRQYGKCDRLHDASSPAAPVASHYSSEYGSDRGHWKPINPQAALRTTPPTMPETLVLARSREDTDVQTPSTLRPAVPTREAISNIAHTRPTAQTMRAEASQHADLSAAPLEVAEQRASTFGSVQQNAETDWDALNRILKFQQCETETLAQYLARFQAIATQFPADCDIVSACLRRLVIGMVRNEEKQFVRDWLMTSEWTLENVRDCILLLTRCKTAFSTSQDESGSVELQATVTGLAERSHNGQGFRHPSSPHSHSERNLQTALPAGGQLGKRHDLPQQMESQDKRVQPARAAKIQKMGKASEFKKCQIGDISVTHQPNNANDQQDKVAGNALDMGSALTAGMNPVAKSVSAQQNVAMKKKSHTCRLQRELKSLMNTKLIEKPMKEQTTPQKRKSLHEPDEDIQTASRPDQNSQSPLARRHNQSERVPTLVARKASKAVTLPETSDALRLPSMPTGPYNCREGGNREVGSVGRKPSHENSPKLPVLTLSTSDFQE